MEKKSKSVLFSCITILLILVPLWLYSYGLRKNSGSIYSDPDSLFYYRIIDQAYQKGSIDYVDFDNYGNFPYKFKIGYPRLYFWFLYWVKVLSNKILPSDSDLLMGLFPVVSVTLTSIIIIFTFYHLGYPSVFILFSTFLMIPSFSAFEIGSFAKWDYDHIVSIYLWLWIVSAMCFREKPELKWVITGGVFGGLLLGSWLGSLLIFFVITVTCFILWFCNSNLKYDYLPYCYKTFAVATALNVVIMLFSPSKYGTSLLDFGIIHIVAMILATLGIWGLTKFDISLKSKCSFIVIGAIVLVIFAIIDTNDFFDLMERFSGQDPIYQDINELQPLVSFSNLFENIESFRKAFNVWGFFIVLLPVFCFVPLEKILKHKSASILQIWLNISVLASLWQNRYIRLLGIGNGLVIAILLYFLWKSIYSLKKDWGFKVKCCCAFVVILLLVRIQAVWCFLGAENNIRSSEIEAFNWIKNNTPVTFGYADNKEPQYGILSYWDMGNYINYYTKRPVVANNMQNGVKHMATIFSSKNEEKANKICKDLKIKYILMNPDRILFPSTIDFWPAYENQPPGPGYLSLSPKVERSKDYENWFFNWLNKYYGLHNIGEFGTSSFFRIIYANMQENASNFSNLIFERVEGAKVVIKAKPLTKVSIATGIKINGTFFTYRKETQASSDGFASFTVPYANYYRNGSVSVNELYDVSLVSYETNKNVTGKMRINEDEVSNGKAVATSSIIIFK